MATTDVSPGEASGQSAGQGTNGLFQACLAEAADSGRSMMDRLVQRARNSLYQGAGIGNDAHERLAPTEALRLLNKHEAELADAFPAALRAAFAESGADKPKAAPKSTPLALALEAPSFGELELMDESQVQESVEVARALQGAQMKVEAELSELNALVCGVQGLKAVAPDRNPFRPETYVRTLQAVLKRTDVVAAVRLRWMQHMGMALGEELKPVYAKLSAMLRDAGVAPAGYTVIQAPDAPSVRLGASSAAAAAAGAEARARNEVLLTVDQLRRLLSGELDRGGAAPADESFAARFAREFESTPRAAPPADFSATVPAAFEALQEMKAIDEVVERLTSRKQAQAAGAPPSQIEEGGAARERLRRDARGLGQSLGLEVVNLMVDNIAADTRLLAPVRQAVRDFEPALLRLALIDPRFFSDRQHPARRLLEQLTQRSMAWDDASAPGFAVFMEPLRQVVDALSGAAIDGPEPFAFALKSLEEMWAQGEQEERRDKEKAMKALLHAEQRNLLAAKTAAEIRGRADALVAPPAIVHFLCGAWAQVIAQARLTDEAASADPHGYAALVNDILWSAMPELTRRDPQRLAGMVPQMLAKLREGLKRIDYPAVRTNAFFDELGALHRQALKVRSSNPIPGSEPAAAPPPATAPLSLAELAAQKRAELEAQFDNAKAAGLWLAPAEAQQSGFMDTLDAIDASPAFEPTKPGFSATQPLSGLPRRPLEEMIPPGSWVEFELNGKRTRSQLTWASPHGSLFMFTSSTGGNYSMTRQSLDKLLADGAMRVLADQAVVDEALDGVAQTAMRNSLDISL